MNALTPVECHITLADGRVIRANNLLQLARKWAEAENGDNWQTLSPAQQSVHISDALAELTQTASNN